jgi:transposase-like protein
VASWRHSWEQLIPFIAYLLKVRWVFFTANAIESVNMQLRKIIKNRSHLPINEAASKLNYLALRNITAKLKMHARVLEVGAEPVRRPLCRLFCDALRVNRMFS